MKISEHNIERMRARGLYVNELYPTKHVFSDGVFIGKPVGIAGNSIPHYTTALMLNIETGEKVDFDAPPVVLYVSDNAWIVLSEEYTPGPGPGDFTNHWQTEEEAVNDILELYFGDPVRMRTKAEGRKTSTV